MHKGKEIRQGKFSDTAKRGVLLGYQEGHHNYRVWFLDEKKLFYSHVAIFEERIFPFKEASDLSPSSSAPKFTHQSSDFLSDTPDTSPDATYVMLYLSRWST